jgi:hypothetical protein
MEQMFNADELTLMHIAVSELQRQCQRGFHGFHGDPAVQAQMTGMIEQARELLPKLESAITRQSVPAMLRAAGLERAAS